VESYRNKVLQAAKFIQERIKIAPSIGFVMGTGLSEMADVIEISEKIDYQDIPYFPVSTVQTHRGRLIFGIISGRNVVAMQGRVHFYEGYHMRDVTFPIRVMQTLGVSVLIITNAAGGINPLFSTGDIMLIADHINLMGTNPLIGPNEDTWGPRFPDMSQAYDGGLMALAEKVALEQKIRLQKGVYVALPGPSLETGAEIRFLKTIGADAVGLSTVPEVIVAVHARMRVLGFSIITNMNLADNLTPSLEDDIIAVAQRTAPKLKSIVAGVIGNLEKGEGL